MNLLLTTIGKVWQLIPELAAYTNPVHVPLYHRHPQKEALEKSRQQHQIEPLDAVWILSTDMTDDEETAVSVRQNILAWKEKLQWPVELKFFILQGVSDLTTDEQILQMRDLIYRVTLHAQDKTRDGQLLLSLVGGRKTMSADIQQAGYLFGCQAMLHVLDNPAVSRNDFFESFSFAEPIPEALADAYLPVVVGGRLHKNVALDLPPAFVPGNYPLTTENGINYIQPQSALAQDVEKRLTEARNLMYNFSVSLSSGYNQTNYRALYALSPAQIQQLQRTIIGVDPQRAEQEKEWLRKLPRAELHCHFGGILNVEEMIEVARANARRIAERRQADSAFDKWLRQMAALVQRENLAALQADIPEVKQIRERFPGVAEPLTVAAFLSLFDGKAPLLERFIFGDYLKEEEFSGIGIERYESLGDLQGSALMQSEESIRAACRILIRKCEQHNVRYLEVRQSPVKYTRGGLSAKQVVDLIREELTRAQKTTFRAIIIASRHGKMSEVHQHIELAQELFARDASYRQWIVAFDLAGAEGARKPSELREAFLPLMKESLNLTIHAGENQPVQNIWEAVYHLNADRIGHGLTLKADDRLRGRFLDRKITIEMCPSSNEQIIGYGGNHHYPLKDYLSEGLRVTVNTDNPGISRTSFSHEYYKAARLSGHGLSLWEILQLIRNGFRGAFLPFAQRQKMLLASEKEILEILKEQFD